MFQSSFTGLKPLHRNSSYRGGFCKFWYIPVENIGTFPRVNALNQWLVDEPTIINGASWFGPIEVPRDRLGFSETPKRSKAGVIYEYKVEGLHVGDSAESRVNLENSAFHRYLVVGKVRAGGFYMLIGTVDSPCRFDAEYKTGGGGDTAGSNFIFSSEHISKAYILPSFNAATTGSGIGGGGAGGVDTMNNKEVIPFDNVLSVAVPWTPTRQSRFGSFPIVEVWMDDGVNPIFLNMGADIRVDQPPPAFTQMDVIIGGGGSSGFIVIS